MSNESKGLWDDGKQQIADGLPETRGKTNRRIFLKSAGTLAIGSAVGYGAYAGTRPKLRLALLGAGKRASQHCFILKWMHHIWPVDVELVHIVDPNLPKARKLAAEYASNAEASADYRRALDDQNVDAVLIASCDHWHAKMSVDAMRAGKGVYCEKPMSITYGEAQDVLQVARETKSVYQLGTQQRHNSLFRDFAALVMNGRVGDIKVVEVLLNPNRFDASQKRTVGAACPEDLDWNLWKGPAGQHEYCPEVVDDGWKSMFQFSGGETTNWGSHHWDIGNWILESQFGPDCLGSCKVVPTAEFADSELYDVPTRYRVEFTAPDRPTVIIASAEEGGLKGLRIEGSEGQLFVNRGSIKGKAFENLSSSPLPAEHLALHNSLSSKWGKPSTALHLGDFFNCVLKGGTPLSDVETSARMNTFLQLANVACRLNEPLQWDHEARLFANNEKATSLLQREQYVANKMRTPQTSPQA